LGCCFDLVQFLFDLVRKSVRSGTAFPFRQDSLYVGFGADDDVAIGAKLVAYTLVGIAKEHGVPVSWNGDTMKKVCLGDADAYDDDE